MVACVAGVVLVGFGLDWRWVLGLGLFLFLCCWGCCADLCSCCLVCLNWLVRSLFCMIGCGWVAVVLVVALFGWGICLWVCALGFVDSDISWVWWFWFGGFVVWCLIWFPVGFDFVVWDLSGFGW